MTSIRIVIVGGGYSGSCLAVQLVRQAPQPLAITIVEARPQIGPGLAYSTMDPDHRLNAPSFSHTIQPADAWHCTRWCRDEGVLEEDPAAVQPDGTCFVRRHQFGRYLAAMVQQHSNWPATGSTIAHCHDKAMHAECKAGVWQIHTDSGKTLAAHLLCLATGHAELHMPGTWQACKHALPGLLENPFARGAMDSLQPTERTLVIGSGLTALDVLATMIRRGHAGPIDVISRNGLRPMPQGPLPESLRQALQYAPLEVMPGSLLLDRVLAGAPDYLLTPPAPARKTSVRRWLKALRHRLTEGEILGQTWHAGFDELRDAVWQLWPTLPLEEKRRFIRHLKPWYDIHRYRSPPPVESLVQQAEREGRIRFLRGTISPDGRLVGKNLAATPVASTYDRVINAAGLDKTSGLGTNPVLMSLHTQGFLRADPCGLGMQTDLACRAVGTSGLPVDQLRLVGPPTLGTFGDPIGAIYIAMQVHRQVPQILAGLPSTS